MKNLNSEVFNKNKKRNNILLIIGLILLAITILLIYLGIKYENQKLPEEISMNELISKGREDEKIYSYIDVNIRPYLFAVYETDGVEENAKFYFVMDKENYLYIVYMNDKKYDELNKESIKDNPIKINGLTKKIPNDIKDLAIESYNKLMEDTYLTKENFKEYVGLIYLDTVTSVYDSSIYYVGSFLTGFFFILIIIIYIVIVIKSKKTLNNISEEELAKIDAEINNINNELYSKMKIYLLKDYIVDLGNSIVILKYEDLLWAYPFEQRYNGLLINKCIKLVDKKNKKYDVASSKILDKNKDEILQEILKEIKEKNQDVLLGFNTENRKKVKEKLKEIKENNKNQKKI